MTVADIDRVLSLCEQHLNQTNSRGTEVEVFLTKFLLVHICGEYEKEIERIVFERAEKTGDLELASYLKRTGVGRGLKITNLKHDLLGRFSDGYVQQFESIIKDETSSRYSNIVTNRHLSAHGDPINMTFDELVKSFPHAKLVIKTISDILKK